VLNVNGEVLPAIINSNNFIDDPAVGIKVLEEVSRRETREIASRIS